MIKKESSWSLKSSKSYPRLTENIEADAVVVGGGITGIFNAYILAKAGLKVALLEKNENILQGVTLATTAFIVNAIDTPLSELVTLFGKKKARLVWQSGQDAVKLFADIVKKENIDCEFQNVSEYNYASSKKQFAELSKEYSAIKKYGFEVELYEKSGKLNFSNAGFMEIPRQAKFHPIKFAQSLAKKAELMGVRIFTSSEVLAIKDLTVKTKDGKVKAKDIILATYAPFTNEGIYYKKGMYLSYVYELEIEKDLIAEGLYQDMHNPYHYFRIDSGDDFDRMIVGGEDNREDISVSSNKNFYALEEYIKTVLENNPYKITRKWYGGILEPSDGLALIGMIKPHTYVATAFSGNGMAYSAISATIIRDLILGNENPHIELYKPLRSSTIKTKLIKAVDYIEEFFGGVFKNFFLPKN